jgi:hypothetical protein
MSNNIAKILPPNIPEIWQSVTWFTNSPDVGDPDCLCSLCASVIEASVPIRIYADKLNLEARFHHVCFLGKAKITHVIMPQG